MVLIPSADNPNYVIQNPYGRYYFDNLIGQPFFETANPKSPDDTFKFLYHELMQGNGMTQFDGQPGPFITPDLSGRSEEDVAWWHDAAQKAQQKMWDTYGTLSPSAPSPAPSSSPLMDAVANQKQSAAPTPELTGAPELPQQTAQNNVAERYLKSSGSGAASGPYLDDTLNKSRKQSRGLGSSGGF